MFSHLYINLSRIESFGITLIEGLASQLPVITFDTKGGNELVIDNHNGKVLKNYSAEEMANAIIDYQKNSSLYEIHKKNTLISVEQFDLNKISEKTIKVYKDLIS